MVLTLFLIGTVTFTFDSQSAKAEVQVGVKAGDWIKHTYTISGWPSGEPYPLWLKVEFLSVEGTNATINVTMHMSDGTEQNDTITVDIAGGGEDFQGLSGFVIPANSTTGDSIYISGYGNVTIAGETTEAYAGASRTVVYASFSQYGTQLTYYWDKLTGVMVEASTTSGGVTATAKATETNMWKSEAIYIKADGSIYPSDAPISTTNNITYTLTGNITSNTYGIIVERNNIIIDGAKFTIRGNKTDYGISMIGISNVTIKNVIIEAFHYGIDLYLSSNNTIVNSNIANNWVGISLFASSNNTITGNNVTENDWYGIGFAFGRPCGNNTIFDNNIKSNGKTGIYLQSSHNTISENNITANIEYGIYIQESSNTIIHKNNITGNGQGIFLDESSNNTVSLNFIAENSEGAILLSSSAYYNTFSQNTIIANNGSRGYVPSVIEIKGSWNIIHKNNVTANKVTAIGVSGSHNNVSENYVAKNEYGIQLYYSSDNIICRNNISESNMVGLLLIMSSNNIISDNIFANDGMAVAESYSNTVEDNLVNGKPLVYLENVSGYTVQEAGQVILVNCTGIEVENLNLSYTPVGIQLSHTTNTNITDNHITNNTSGIYLSYSSNYNTISQNNLTSNDYGIYLYHSSNNKMIENNIIANNESGVYIGYSSGNQFYRNNFIGNTKHVNVDPSGYVNTWDNRYPSGGNYWSNYTGVDLYWGSSQNKTGSDGIGDAEYTIDSNNRDRYPLMAPFTAFEAGIWNEAEYFVDVVSNSTVSDFHFNPEEGPFLKFNVTGENGTVGFCRVTVPRDLLWVEDGWAITVDNQQIIDYLEMEDENNTYLYFTYNHSIQTVTVQGTSVIPEFPSSIALLGFLTLITIPLTFAKKKRFKKAKT